jgi:hypothetical protein
MVVTEIYCERSPPKAVVSFRPTAADHFRTVMFTGALGYGMVVTDIHCERPPPKAVVSFRTIAVDYFRTVMFTGARYYFGLGDREKTQ